MATRGEQLKHRTRAIRLLEGGVDAIQVAKRLGKSEGWVRWVKKHADTFDRHPADKPIRFLAAIRQGAQVRRAAIRYGIKAATRDKLFGLFAELDLLAGPRSAGRTDRGPPK